MYVLVAGFHSRASIALAASALLLCVACGGDKESVALMLGSDAGNDGVNEGPPPDCDMVEIDGDVVVRQIDQVTATFQMGEPYDKTVMLFGGEPFTAPNSVSNVYVIGLDKDDALMLSERYVDFHLCNSPGGIEAQNYITDYDLVPATCRVHDEIIEALEIFHRNNAAGGDRASLRFDGAPLQLQSVIVDGTGEDVTDQLVDRNFHLVTAVEQLTGESVLSFGTSE